MQLRERLALAGVRPQPQPKAAASVPKGFCAGHNRYGEVLYRDQHWPLDHRHGSVALEEALSPDPVLLDRLAPDLDAAHIQGAAFLDIETTGLSGGTGTYAFLVGVGTFEGYTFRVRQFFLGGPAGEAAMLTAIAETVDRCQSLVTFNGKSFDLPQLCTRYTLQRLAPLATDLPHVDLLHPARRLFGRRLESCRLGEIEREVLGFRRVGDLPSWMIPGLYFAYIRRRDAAGLHPVFEHNTLDVISLAGLIAALNSVAGGAAEGDGSHLLVLGRWDEARRRRDSAARLYQEAWRNLEGDEAGEAAWRLARLRRRAGDWAGCTSVWTQEQAAPGLRRQVRANIELAKIAEHHSRDVGRALSLSLEADRLLRANPGLARMLPRTTAALAHRLARLERRSYRGRPS
jgi:uncharacterized protein YprB with RNaseH-like and TPR domain